MEEGQEVAGPQAHLPQPDGEAGDVEALQAPGQAMELQDHDCQSPDDQFDVLELVVEGGDVGHPVLLPVPGLQEELALLEHKLPQPSAPTPEAHGRQGLRAQLHLQAPQCSGAVCCIKQWTVNDVRSM